MWQSLRGRERLIVAFWMYCVLGGLLVAVMPTVLAQALYDMGVPVWVLIVLALMQALYFIWAHVSVWMCAFNSSRPLWGYAARGYVCLVALSVVTYMLWPRQQPEIEVRQLSSAQHL